MVNPGADEEKANKLLDLISSIEAGEITAAEAAQEFANIDAESTVASVVASNKAIEELENENLGIEDAEKLIHKQADLHPTATPLFIACSLIANKQRNQLDLTGYIALSKIKNDRYLTEEVARRAYTKEGAFSKLMATLEEKKELLKKDLYISEGAGDHVIDHFLVQELADTETMLDPETLKLVLERKDGIEPILIGFLRDLLGPQIAIAPKHTLMYPIKILGHWKSLDALPLLLKALNLCVTEQLQEIIMALVKLGSEYPVEVSEGLIGMINDPNCEDARFAAIETLGYLWSKEDNLEFLTRSIASLDLKDAFFNGMFSFLAQSLLMTGQEEASRGLSEVMEKDREKLSENLVERVGKGLELFKPQDDDRMEKVATENIYEICCKPPAAYSKNWRSTMSLRREKRLAEESGALKELEITRINELMKTAKDELCPCGSKKEFQNCCLPKLEAQKKLIDRK
ncbi:MAG: SEC-C domain-containing protein [Actinobacteria bacterium]|nr:SEC-C domain-containing protein [Actinomycetota bacterium]